MTIDIKKLEDWARLEAAGETMLISREEMLEITSAMRTLQRERDDAEEQVAVSGRDLSRRRADLDAAYTTTANLRDQLKLLRSPDNAALLDEVVRLRTLLDEAQRFEPYLVDVLDALSAYRAEVQRIDDEGPRETPPCTRCGSREHSVTACRSDVE